ncbi:PspC domain-containing protein [Gordonia sp. CPCC 205515]|uniref:PspC domain-containing protein n=1 Tax=Gordonia sp. CPCC 205515 TaxID=3140791 RepID=UPI003AF3BDFF
MTTPVPATQRLMRSRDDRWIGGVCGGIAERYGWDATLIRVLFVASILLPGPQVLLYLILWVIIPREPAVSNVAYAPPITYPPAS